jgi:hypothetical protein
MGQILRGSARTTAGEASRGCGASPSPETVEQYNIVKSA